MYAAAANPLYAPGAVRFPSWGLGVASQTGQLALSAGSTAASSAVSIAVATGAIAGPVGAAIGAGIALAALAIEAIMNSGCGQTCIVSTQFANQANAALQQNIEAYFALPVPRSYANQQAALANFDRFWAWLQTQCGNPQLGSAGQRCITDRQAGACTWKQPASEVPAWGVPPAGSCWNWFNGYRDPIANDPNVVPASQADVVGAAASSALAPFGISLPSWWPVAAAALVVAWVAL
jgi:hypothetical protein